MQSPAKRGPLVVSALVLFGAVIFGMVLASGLSLTPSASTEGAAGQGPQSPASPPSAAGGLPDFADLAEAVLPAVVSVQASTIDTLEPGSANDPFHFFFRRRAPGDEEPREYRSEGAGSGFVVSPDGWIVTNFHVIQDATEVKVRLHDREYEAEVKGTDESTDLALLRVDAGSDLEYLALGDSDALRVGEWVMAIGNPLSLESSVTVGVVSAKGRRGLGLTDSSFENFIQTDAAINRGNSGGPLINLAGEVVGISTAMNFGAENIGFAVPANTLRQILPQLKDEGRVRRGYLGVSIANLDFEGAEAFGLESTDGALIQDVIENTPAAAADLRPGDVILEVDGHRVAETRDLIDYVSSREPGTDVTLELVREGQTISKKVDLRERGELTTVAEAEEEEESADELEWLGLQYQDLTRAARAELSIPRQYEGVVVRDVAASSPLYEEQVRPGQLISEVNGEPISSVGDFEAAVGNIPSGELIRLYVLRFGPGGGRNPFFAIVRKP